MHSSKLRWLPEAGAGDGLPRQLVSSLEGIAWFEELACRSNGICGCTRRSGQLYDMHSYSSADM